MTANHKDSKLEKIQTVYEKYRHLDALLSNEKLLSHEFCEKMLFDLWQAIKESLDAKK